MTQSKVDEFLQENMQYLKDEAEDSEMPDEYDDEEDDNGGSMTSSSMSSVADNTMTKAE